MNMQEKVRENRVRRKADRMGLELHKSPRRDPDAMDYGGWRITDRFTGVGVAPPGSPDKYYFTLDQVETFLQRVARNRAEEKGELA